MKAKYQTQNGTATAPADFTAKSGNITIGKNKTSTVVRVSVKGDKLDEPDEVFVVQLSNPTGATIVDPIGIGMIVDND